MTCKRNLAGSLECAKTYSVTALICSIREKLDARLERLAQQAKHAFFPLVLLLFICTCDATRGQSDVSPKLWEFLTEHPAASQMLSNVLSEAFTN
jgi:hypothetical protein